MPLYVSPCIFVFVQSILNKIIQNCNANPGDTAIVGEHSLQVTYGELLHEALIFSDSIAGAKSKCNWVAVDVAIGWRFYAAALACWMQGKGYMPIDFTFPESRIFKTIHQAAIDVVVSDEKREGLISIWKGSSLKTNAFKQGDFAYLLFTSGTTGEPKGVPIAQQNLNSFVEHYLKHENIKLSKNDVFLQSYGLTFDVSVFCWVMPFLLGATLALPNKGGNKYLNYYKAINDYQVTVTSFVPSVVRLTQQFLPRAKFDSVRYSFFSGETLLGSWAKAWMQAVPNAQVYNCYGPTETVIVCTEELLNILPEFYFETGKPLPLGVPFDGINLELINGEIVFSGAQCFAGYLKQSPQEKFHSGDLAAYDKHKKLIFNGRKDEQIQWNGYRIELPEIDICIQQRVKKWCKTVFLEDSAALVVFTTEDPKEIGAIIARNLPAYYKPTKIVQLTVPPLNSNGKLDVAALKQLALLS